METISALFAEATEQFRQRTVLLEPTGDGGMITLNYSTLQERVHRFTGYLQAQKLAKGERILLWSANRIDWMVAYLGALLLGAVVVLLDVNSNEEFLTKIALTTEAKYLITTQKEYNGLKHSPIPFIDIDALPQRTLDTAKLPAVNGSDLAVLAFTSGTTSQPKGVMLSHRNITSNALMVLEVMHIVKDDRALSILPLSHMLELTIELAILHSGASIIYARSLIPDILFQLLGSQDVTCMVLVPQALQLFMNGIERQVRRQKRERQWELLHRVAPWLPFSLRRVPFNTVHKRFGGHFHFFVSGGEYLPPKLHRRWENMGFRVLQGYGATECAVVSLTSSNEHLFGSTGRPLPGEQVRIADEGEFLVHGTNVALGYWKDPEATFKAFEDGWFHTGDLGSQDEKGNLYLKGRKKNVIVLANSLNVYPEDIENVLLTNPEIRDVVVVGLMEGDAGPIVHAVLSMKDPTHAKALIERANKQLASHQQIRGYTIWPEVDFPRTHLLKVNRPKVMEKLAILVRW
jgi:long-chain acyl-CoA synthetase